MIVRTEILSHFFPTKVNTWWRHLQQQIQLTIKLDLEIFPYSLQYYSGWYRLVGVH